VTAAAARRRRGGWPAVGPLALLAGLAYLPALLTGRDVVAADTKQYLYLDPGRYLAGAASLWDPDQFGGWVTHQTIGYLWPMGPFHWLLDTIGVPTWLAQRLWLATLLVLGGMGVWWCCRVLGLSRPGALAGAVLYQLSPYVVLYAPRTSVLLLPWAGLGWLVGLTVLATRRGGWRWPAAVALVVATVAGTNATAVLMIGIGPALWLVWAVAGSREVPARAALAAAGRIALLSLGTCAGWIVAIAVQARYGADVLAYSETVEAVSSTSLASEVVRGLGYWLFYGSDVTGAWNSAADVYLTAPALIGLGFALAFVGVAAAVAVRWRQRGFVALLLLVGTVISVGAHPLADPSLFGRLLAGSTRSTIVLALRRRTRALPLVVLALALAVAAAVTALGARLPSTASLVAGVVVVLAALQLPALWNGTYVDALQRRPEGLPAWWTGVAGAADAFPEGTRLLELPGAEFAAYRWGTTNDAVLPGLTSRPTLTRDLLPLGSPALMDLLLALDDRFQTGTVEGQELAAAARLLGVGGIVVRGDTAFERFRTPRPEPTEALYAAGPAGLGEPQALGPPAANVAPVGQLDELSLADSAVGSPVSPVLLVPVDDPQPILRTRAADAPIVLAGDGEGVVAAAAAGIVDGARPVLYAAAVTPQDLAGLASGPGATLVVTDSNRRRARQWRGSQDTTGFTEGEERATGVLRDDEADARLPVFPDAPDAAWTTAEQRGGATVRATSYGEPNAYRPEDRPYYALDGDPTTAWLVGDRGEAEGERLRVDFDEPRTVDELTVLQPATPSNRWITSLEVETDGGRQTFVLDDTSRHAPGQTITLGDAAGPTGFVALEVAATNVGRRASYAGVGTVGITELGFGAGGPDALRLDEVVVLPTDLLSAAGPASLDRELAFVLTRLRHDPYDRWRDDEERALVRQFELPAARSFAVGGTARLSARASDEVLAPVVAATTGDPSARAHASSRLAGSPASWGPAAVDGDPGTAWTTAFGITDGATISVSLPQATTLDHLDLRVVDDGRHSVPIRFVLRTDEGEERILDVPPVPATEPGGVPPPVTVSFPPLTTDAFSLTVAVSTPRTTVDRRYGDVVVLPIAIAELGLPAVPGERAATPFDSGCRSDLVTVDGTAVPVRITGTAGESLLDRPPLAVEWCGAGDGLVLGPGVHELRTRPGLETGLDLDRLVLTSAPGGAAAPTAGSPAEPTPAPAVQLEDEGRTSIRATATGTGEPFWLVLGQGYNGGWHAEVNGRDLGPPQLVDGGMNGWLVEATQGEALEIELTWGPQRWVNVGLFVAAASVLACLVLLVVPWRRGRATGQSPSDPAAAPSFVGLALTGPRVTWRVALLAGTATALLAIIALPPWTALVVGPATTVALAVPRLRRLPAIGALSCLALVGLSYVARQVVSQPAAGFGWPSAFERAHVPALLAVVLVAADALVAAIRERAGVHYPAARPTRREPR
jgi:arabinofuranan 3-O-arabinosyltransferase